MRHNTTLRRTASLAALAATIGSAALAGGASAATFSAPAVLTPGATIPIDFPGYREPASGKLPANYRIVRIKAALGRDEQVARTLKAPAGFRLVTLGVREGANVFPQVRDRDYVGKRSVRVTFTVNRRAVKAGQTATGTTYLLARRA